MNTTNDIKKVLRSLPKAQRDSYRVSDGTVAVPTRLGETQRVTVEQAVEMKQRKAQRREAQKERRIQEQVLEQQRHDAQMQRRALRIEEIEAQIKEVAASALPPLAKEGILGALRVKLEEAMG